MKSRWLRCLVSLCEQPQLIQEQFVLLSSLYPSPTGAPAWEDSGPTTLGNFSKALKLEAKLLKPPHPILRREHLFSPAPCCAISRHNKANTKKKKISADQMILLSGTKVLSFRKVPPC